MLERCDEELNHAGEWKVAERRAGELEDAIRNLQAKNSQLETQVSALQAELGVRAAALQWHRHSSPHPCCSLR